MRRRYIVTAGLLLALGLPTAPTSAAPTSSTLTITATKSSALVVRLAHAVTLNLSQPGDPGPTVRITGGGEAAGFLLLPERGGPSTGMLALRQPGWTPYLVAGEPVTRLPAGTYRLHVAASSPVTITVPVQGMARTTWRPSGPLAFQRAVAAWPVPGGPAVTGSVPIRLTARSVVVFLLGYHATGAGDSVAVCVTDSQGLCTDADGIWRHDSTTQRAGADLRQGLALIADTTDLHAGDYTARWRILSHGAATEPFSVAYVVG